MGSGTACATAHKTEARQIPAGSTQVSRPVERYREEREFMEDIGLLLRPIADQNPSRRQPDASLPKVEVNTAKSHLRE